MGKTHIKILSLLTIIVLFFNLTGCKKTEAKPILKVLCKSEIEISPLFTTNSNASKYNSSIFFPPLFDFRNIFKNSVKKH